MKTKWFSVLLVLVSFFALVVGACSSAPSASSNPALAPSSASIPVPAPSPAPVSIAGTWRFTHASGVFIMKIDTKGAGSFELFDPDGSSMNMIVEADGSGSIKLGQTNAQYGGLVDVIAGGKYLGEQLTITGWMDAPFSLYNNNPPKPISLGGTSWINPREVPVVYVLNDDGSFRIDLGPQVQAFNDAFWKADTEGTYTINGIEVTLNYPNGRALEFVEASNGGISVVPAQTDSQRIYIEGDSFLLGYAVFALTE